MRQKMFWVEKRHDYLILVQELILKVAEKYMWGVLIENRLNQIESKRLNDSGIELRKWAGCRTVSNNGSGSGLAPAQNILAVQVGSGALEHYFRGSGLVQVHSRKILLVQVRFGFIDLKFNCRYSFRPKKKKEKLLILLMIPLLLLCVYQRQRHPDMERYILTFVRGSGSVWVHLSTILRVQVWFRFTEVKFCWFRFGSGSPK